MRDLSIKRNKSFVGCLAKLKVYIEDIYSKDIVINGVPCRKLGELKNGEMKTFQIGEESAKVFVIADKISKGYCNEFYIIPDGDEEVCLTGACKFNPATGNAFQFENNNNEEVLLNRKRNNRKGIIVLIVAALVGLIFGFLVGNLLIADNITQQKTFNKDDISITLNNKFNEYSQDGFFATYATEDVAVFVIREEFSLFEDSENMTIDDYAELVRANNTYKASELEKDDSLVYFEYEFDNTEVNIVYKYRAYLFKSDDSFWIVTFSVDNNLAAEYADAFSQWAESVEFDS